MLPLILAVITASLLGSAHCAGMCGAFVAFAVGASPHERAAPRWALNLAYNLGRLVTYITLGIAAGALGAALDLGASMVGVQRVAAMAAGAIMVGFGLIAILRLRGVRIPRVPLPRAITQLAAAGHRRAFDLSPLARAAAVGLLTTLLPCGWLYAFVITAAGTANPAYGALTMTAFWLGTLPIMGAIGFGVGAITGSMRKHLPLVTSLLLVAVGTWTLVNRATMPTLTMRPVPESLSAATAAVGDLSESAPKCPLCDDQ